jgi:hypothetical protein
MKQPRQAVVHGLGISDCCAVETGIGLSASITILIDDGVFMYWFGLIYGDE